MSHTGKFKAAVKKAKSLYKTGRYKNFGLAVKAAYKKTGSAKPKRKKSSLRAKRSNQRRRRVGTVSKKRVARVGSAPRGSKRQAVEKSLGNAYVRYVKATTIKATKAANRQMKEARKKLKSL